MKPFGWIALAGLVGVASCAESPPAAPETFTVPLVSAARHAESHHFGAPLNRDNEVAPPAPILENGRGVATFALSEDGTELSYKLITANLSGITQAHIHIGAADANGPVVVFLYGFNAAGTDNSGILAEGVITAANLIPRPAIGFGGTMPELIHALRTGNAYANVHTLANPPGAIRGQIAEHGPTK